MFKMVKKYFDISEKEIKKMKNMIEKINNLEDEIEKLTDDELKEKTTRFKYRITKKETIETILPEAFAVVREASKRVLKMRHYDVQLMGGIALHNGNIAEMKTGEGKTLVATLPVYLNAITGKGVHVITVNEYLAKRDCEEMGRLYDFLGLKVGLNLSGMTPEEKKEAYEADITYGTNNEFGFDYLRDNMVLYNKDRVQRGLNFAIVDEVDSILIDEARTPLIISGQAEKSAKLYNQADLFVRSLKKDTHYTYDIETKNVLLAEEGMNRAESAFGIENLFDIEHTKVVHHINKALQAHIVMQKDKDYVVKDEEIMIVDQFTGRIMKGRRFSEGLHQAIEAKEKVEIQNESMTLATITFQNYFRMYRKLSGMTGTAKTEEEEFRQIYNMDVIVIPTNKPIVREDKSDMIYQTIDAKFNAIVKEIERRHKKGQPLLVGTANIESSEYLSSILQKTGIDHYVLNAKNHEQEADIITSAGEKGSVTIATNMAGRGTDIKINEEVRGLGGLCVIGTERHESRRIDNQLRGRSGRQGDVGASVFYLSLEDELMKRFGGDNLKKIMARMGLEEDEVIESKMVSKTVESAQKRVEGNNFDARKWVLKYDDVLREQREIIYNHRDEVLEDGDLFNLIFGMVKSTIERIVNEYTISSIEEEWDVKHLKHYLNNRIFDGEITEDMLRGKERKEIIEEILERAENKYKHKREEIGDLMLEFEKNITLRTIDGRWMEHIDSMTELRQGIHLRGYGQNDPLREYQFEGFNMFEEMITSIEENITMQVMKMEVIKPMDREQVVKINPTKKEKKPKVDLKIMKRVAKKKD